MTDLEPVHNLPIHHDHINKYVVVVDGRLLLLYNEGEVIADHFAPLYGGLSVGGWWLHWQEASIALIAYKNFGSYEQFMPHNTVDTFGYAWNVQNPDQSQWRQRGPDDY